MAKGRWTNLIESKQVSGLDQLIPFPRGIDAGGSVISPVAGALFAGPGEGFRAHAREQRLRRTS
jgi:hypothetical protein